jgi:hypothetical protein
MYDSSRVGADIRAMMVSGDEWCRCGLFVARLGDSVGVGYRISDNGSMPSDSQC